MADTDYSFPLNCDLSNSKSNLTLKDNELDMARYCQNFSCKLMLI